VRANEVAAQFVNAADKKNQLNQIPNEDAVCVMLSFCQSHENEVAERF
jgi:hypothetical protein